MKTLLRLTPCLQVVLAVAASTLPAKGQTTNEYDFESFLGKSLTSPEVQDFIKSNRLVHEPTSARYSICQNTNSNSPFILCLCSNQIYMVSVTLVSMKMEPYTFPPYTGKLPHGLKRGETTESVILRLGPPTNRKVFAGNPSLWYQKLRLEMDFDPKLGLKFLTWREKRD
jgi:hypothetical protein